MTFLEGAKRMSDNVDLVVGFCIPSHLVDAFDDFVTAAVTALDGMVERDAWAEDERQIVEWLESDKWKTNVKLTGRRSRSGGATG